MTGRFADFTNLEKSGRPNAWLVAPEGRCKKAEADAVAPVFDQKPGDLFERVRSVLEANPRHSDIETSEAGWRVKSVAKVPLVGFRDDLDVQVFPADGGSTLAAYSRSRVGYGDFGVNRRRVEWLIAELKKG